MLQVILDISCQPLNIHCLYCGIKVQEYAVVSSKSYTSFMSTSQYWCRHLVVSSPLLNEYRNHGGSKVHVFAGGTEEL